MKKLKSSRNFKALVALTVGTVLLVTAAAAGYVAAGGYSAYKQAAKNMLTRDRYSLSADLTFGILGRTYSAGYIEEFDETGDVILHTATRETNFDGISVPISTERWYERRNDGDGQGKYTRTVRNASFTALESSMIKPEEWNINNVNYFSSSVAEMRSEIGDDEQTGRLIRLIESALDLFVGDLKNNFISTGATEDGGQGYRIALTEEQMPEIVRTGMEFITGELSASSRRIIWRADTMHMADDRYDELYKAARDLRSNGNDIVIIMPDETLNGYPTFKDYYLSGDYEPTTNDIDDLFAIMDGTPRISLAECSLEVDEKGDLTYNRLYGELEYYDLRGERGTIWLEIVINIDDLGAEGIAPPPAPPAGATVYDHSMANASNDYAYSITRNGVTTWSSTKTDQAANEYQWFTGMESAERIQYVCDWFGFPDATNDGTTVAATLTLLYSNGSLAKYADSCGITAEEMIIKLAIDVTAVYGEDAAAVMTAAGIEIPTVDGPTATFETEANG